MINLSKISCRNEVLKLKIIPRHFLLKLYVSPDVRKTLLDRCQAHQSIFRGIVKIVDDVTDAWFKIAWNIAKSMKFAREGVISIKPKHPVRIFAASET